MRKGSNETVGSPPDLGWGRIKPDRGPGLRGLPSGALSRKGRVQPPTMLCDSGGAGKGKAAQLPAGKCSLRASGSAGLRCGSEKADVVHSLPTPPPVYYLSKKAWLQTWIVYISP